MLGSFFLDRCGLGVLLIFPSPIIRLRSNPKRQLTRRGLFKLGSSQRYKVRFQWVLGRAGIGCLSNRSTSHTAMGASLTVKWFFLQR